MAQYNVTSPDGTKYRVTGPDGATDDQVLAQVKAYKAARAAQPASASKPSPVAPSAAPAPDTQSGGPLDFLSGNLNIGIANFLGRPVDVSRQIANLGIAGVGRATGTTPSLIPESSPGGSQSIQALMQRSGFIRPGAQPESGGGRIAASALQAVPSMAIGAGAYKSIPQMIRGGIMAATSGAGGQAGTEVGQSVGGPIGGSIGGQLGAALPMTGSIGNVFRGTREDVFRQPPRPYDPTGPGARATAEGKVKSFKSFQASGIPVLPKSMKVNQESQAVENAVNEFLKQPQGAAVTPEAMKKLRSFYDSDYTAAFKSPALSGGIKPNESFHKSLQAIGDKINSGIKTHPETFKGMGGALKLLQEYGYEAMTPSTGLRTFDRATGKFKEIPSPPSAGTKPMAPDRALESIKKLRRDATVNYQSDDPVKKELAGVQKDISESLEKLVEDNLGRDRAMMNKFRTARTEMAKSYDVMEAMDPETSMVSLQRLAKLLNEGRPLSGKLLELARAARQLPGTGIPSRPEELFTHRVTPIAIQHPPAMSAHWATRAWDPIRRSPIYQGLIVDPTNKPDFETERRIRMLVGTQRLTGNQIPPPPE